MVNNIVLGIAQKIRTVFSETNYSLYTENIEQGFKEPCFFVSLISHTQKQRLGNRYRETYSFDISYYPSADGNTNEECLEVAEGLYEILEYITADSDLLRGTNINSKITEGILHFYVDYNIFVIREKIPETNMEEVIIYGETKEW
ncbi:MAG TPA: hypothetical protein DIC60_03215 [Lachnospiraceae bacterium]|nr:hypothetical protein [Lachnospiraceae bacterium]